MILIVDNEPDLAQITSEALQMEGVPAVFALSAKEAVEIFSQQPIETVVSDAHMPEVSGQELYNLLEQHSKPTPRFYLWSGEKIQTTLPLIPKPCSIEEMVQILQD